MDDRLYATSEVSFETRDDGPGKIVGLASVFFRSNDDGTEFKLFDDMFERIMPEAFDASLNRPDDVRALFNHNDMAILGRTSAGTLRLEKTRRGLKYEIDVPDTQTAKDVAESIRRGDVTGSSFGFRPTDITWREEEKTLIREIRGVELFDVGPVTFPAYEATTTGIRSKLRDEGNQWRAESAKFKMHQERDKRSKKMRARLIELGLTRS